MIQCRNGLTEVSKKHYRKTINIKRNHLGIMGNAMESIWFFLLVKIKG
jgi:hypothetical protein